MRIAFITSHPIPYQVPLFRRLAEKLDLQVYFCTNWGITEKKDPGFGVSFKWDTPLLNGYSHNFLKNYGIGNVFGFLGQINPAIFIELFRNKYDAVIIHGWSNATSWIAWMGGILSGTPILLRGENPLSQERDKEFGKAWLRKVALKIFFAPISKFLYIGEENRLFYKYFGVSDKKLFFTPYAVDNESFIDKFRELYPARSELRAKLGIKEEDVVVLFVGKLISKKRPFDLLRAYEKINMPNKKLIFVGDGELRESLKDYLVNHNISGVIFSGFKNQTELPIYYVLANIFVLPSGTGETWGLVVNEAMCFGLPLLVSETVGCAKDLVRDGSNGYTFKEGDIHELAVRMEELARDGNMAKKYGEKSLEMIEGYSFKVDVEAFMKALEK